MFSYQESIWRWLRRNSGGVVLLKPRNINPIWEPSDGDMLAMYRWSVMNWELWLKYSKGKQRRKLRRRIKKYKRKIGELQIKLGLENNN